MNFDLEMIKMLLNIPDVDVNLRTIYQYKFNDISNNIIYLNNINNF